MRIWANRKAAREGVVLPRKALKYPEADNRFGRHGTFRFLKCHNPKCCKEYSVTGAKVRFVMCPYCDKATAAR